jgi:hypothetical protein
MLRTYSHELYNRGATVSFVINLNFDLTVKSRDSDTAPVR